MQTNSSAATQPTSFVGYYMENGVMQDAKFHDAILNDVDPEFLAEQQREADEFWQQAARERPDLFPYGYPTPEDFQ